VRTVSKPPGRACIASLALTCIGLSLVPTTLARTHYRRGKARVAHARKAKRPAKPVAPGTIIQGRASWYGPGFHGRRTASGERFSRHRFTLAHRGLPFGTRLQITNLKNGRRMVGRVNDRGPHVRGRVVDLSEALARRLGIRGVGRVRCVVLPNGKVGKRMAAGERNQKAILTPAFARTETPCAVDTGTLFGPALPATDAPVSPDAVAQPEMARAPVEGAKAP
jgi:rare lipoprotein A